MPLRACGGFSWSFLAPVLIGEILAIEEQHPPLSECLNLWGPFFRRERQFGTASIRISDRWRNAVPATPYGAGTELFQRRSRRAVARANVQARRCWRPPACSAISTS